MVFISRYVTVMALGIMYMASCSPASASSWYPCGNSCPPAVPVCKPPIVAKLGCCTKSPLYPPPPPVVAPVITPPAYILSRPPCDPNRYATSASRTWPVVWPNVTRIATRPVNKRIEKCFTVPQGHSYAGPSRSLSYRPIGRPPVRNDSF
jgi:hypothetical protein